MDQTGLHIANDADGFTETSGLSFEGLRQYDSEAIAIEIEQCDDALHFLYAEKIVTAATTFLSKFNGTSLYAAKANPHPAVLKLLWKTGMRDFEVASVREVEQIHALLPDATLYFMHPVKSRKAIRTAYALGVRHFAFDSLDELRKIRQETRNAPDLALHLRLSVSQEGAEYPLGNKFGATLIEAPLLLVHARQISEKLGVTFHVGSQCLDVTAYHTALKDIARLLEGAGLSVDMLNVGGGFPVAYPDMPILPLPDYFDGIQQALTEFGFDKLEIFCEPGRALVAQGGAVAVRVEMRRGHSLYLNDGTYGALFDAGQPGWNFPLELYGGGRLGKSDEMALFEFYGPTCDSIDKMSGPFSLPADVAEGDWIIFRSLGAYGYAMQTRFNGFYSETTVAITAETTSD
ncbi:type III PLP-dependent enzyme [Sneathiella marina]|uniref:ornithine decarboxylase n=1 Tax=Sneathiella marina TaxID=2950108 RepID=A0ABY4W2V3_9PROT|nr:type III PLP-dependent enzyme [Sneathiella marina]USG60443.1 type III PLP-dependent enzyme [Sneathiella marina]